LLAYKLEGDHINVLEMHAAVASQKWRLRATEGVYKRAVLLLDSQVCIAVLVKCRSSSRRLNKILQRFNAMVLAGSMIMAFAYVRTDENPADEPSRQNAART
jgi:hypothetical protein